MSRNVKGIVLILLAACCWGFFPTFSRVLYGQGMPVIQVVSARALIAGAIYLIMGFIRGTFKGIKLKDLPFFIGYGIAAILSVFLFYALAIDYLSSAVAAMLLYTAPSFVIIFNRIFYKEKITPIKIAALFITFTGSFFVVRAYDINSLKVGGIGVLFGFLAGIGYSMLTVIGRAGLKKYSPEANTFIPTIATAAIFFVAVPPWKIEILNGAASVLCLLGVGIVGSVLPYLFYLKGLSCGVHSSNAVLLANVEPLVATVCGVFFFRDLLEWPQIIGIALVLTGAALPNLGLENRLKAKNTSRTN